MSYPIDGPTQAVLDGRARGFHWLVEADFTSGTGYYTTAPINIPALNGHTYLGIGNQLRIEDLDEPSKPDTGTINIQVGIVNKAMLALLTGDQSSYRGRAIRVYAQFLTKTFAVQGNPIKRWSGVMDVASVHREKASEDDGSSIGYIELPCIRHGFERVRVQQGKRMTHEQQQLTFAGDLFFQYMPTLIEKPMPWLTIGFQKKS